MTRPATTRRWALHAGLLVVWFLASFGVVFFARDLQWVVAGWPVGYWFAAQGSVLVFICIVVVFAWLANRREPPEPAWRVRVMRSTRANCTGDLPVCDGLLAFLLALALAERWGLPKVWVAGIFLSATLVLYAAIGVYGRTGDAAEYYVAGSAHSRGLQRHGHCRGLDECSIVYQHGRWAVSARFFRNSKHRRVAWPMCWVGRVDFVWSHCW
jgi:cation/acetate symporter